MAAMEPLCLLIGVDPKNFSKEENQLLEADLYERVCAELKEIYRQEYKDYFYLMKFTKDQEDAMLEERFLQNILKDIVASGEYDEKGIAHYANTEADVISELISGLNTKPLAICFRRVIELHRTVRPALYQAIGKKIIAQLMKLHK